MPTMYELTADYMQVLAMASDPEIDEQTIADTLEAIDGEIEQKAEATAIIMQELTAEAEKLKAEEQRLAKRRKSLESNVEAIKGRLYNAMKLVDKPKFKTALFSFSIQKNPPRLVVDDESKVPARYLIEQPLKVDTAALKADLMQSGAELSWAHIEQGESLRIK